MSPVVQVIIDMFYLGLERFGRFYSEYRGFVTNNEDPESMGRLQITVPGIMDNPTDLWVFPSGQFSGNGYGSQMIPQKGDMIFVTFEMGDPNRPLWKFGHFGEDEIPKELKDVNIYWFKTPKGLLIELDDTKGEMRMTDTHGNKMTMSKAGVSIDSPKIFLAGTEKGNNAVAKGNETEKLLAAHSSGILGALKSISSVGKTLSGFASKMAAAGSPAGLAMMLASEVPNIKKALSSTDEETSAANESIKALTKSIPKIKSTKVILNE
jgi:hypothetical protein